MKLKIKEIILYSFQADLYFLCCCCCCCCFQMKGGGGVWTCAAVSFLAYPTKKKCVGVPACTWCIDACMGIVGVVDTICQWLMASLLNFNWGPDELVGGSFSSLIISFWKYQGEIASAWVLFLSLGCWLMCFSRTVWTQTSSKCSIDE